ncbi:copper chaperone PCu(A)C [Microbulbifer sp. SA54]|uniref:copper chaperone PCu(A)C n=1 Tax=Microbulbifer sp. SA54 TaxID=3401577 RepID=UPI003AB0C8FD
MDVSQRITRSLKGVFSVCQLTRVTAFPPLFRRHLKAVFGCLFFSAAFPLTTVAAETAEVKVAALEVVGFARETPPGAPMGVAYLNIHNGGDRQRRLLGVELPRHPKARAELHSTVEESGVSRMRPLAEVTLPKGASLEMQPGATHLMLHGVRLAAGENLPLRLVFADGGTLEVVIPVRADNAAQQQGHHHHHG